MRLHPARAQATLELALILPFIVGLLAISLQGGLVISDQVNLEHSAYDASLWLTSNLSTATVGNTTGCGTVAPAGTIVRHICDQLCGPGGKAGVPTPSYTRYCDSSLRVTTTTTTPQALWTPPPPLSPIRDVMAAGPSPSPSPACQNWALKLAPASATVTAGDPTLGTATYTVAFKGTPSGKGATPVVTL